MSNVPPPPHERQLAILDELAEIGLAVARGLEARIAEADVAQMASISVAYGRAARAVRLTIALRAKVLSEEIPLEKRRAERRAQVQRVFNRAVDYDHATFYAAEAEDKKRDGAERLEHDDIYGDLLARPLSEVVAEICQDLGVNADWSRLAVEAWARDEIAAGQPGAPLASGPPWLPLPDDDDDEPLEVCEVHDDS